MHLYEENFFAHINGSQLPVFILYFFGDGDWGRIHSFSYDFHMNTLILYY